MRTWASQAIAHWKEFQPKRYQALKKLGQLRKEAESAANLTRGDMEVLISKGATYSQAWALVKNRYLFPKDGPSQGPQENSEAGAYEAIKEMQEMLAKAEEEEE